MHMFLLSNFQSKGVHSSMHHEGVRDTITVFGKESSSIIVFLLLFLSCVYHDNDCMMISLFVLFKFFFCLYMPFPL